jgi:hypothetical protein
MEVTPDIEHSTLTGIEKGETHGENPGVMNYVYRGVSARSQLQTPQ